MQSARQFFMVRLVFIGVGLLASAGLRADAMQAPMLCDRGPLRYLFDFDESKSTQHLKLWSAAYSRYAASAYSSAGGTATDNIARLYFNDTNFKLSDAFPNCLVSQNTEFYNPLIRTARMTNEADYTEQTFVFGGRYIVPVYQDVGRIGVRWSVPFKEVQVRRLDEQGVPRGAELEDVIAISGQVIPRENGDNGGMPRVPMVRMDFAEALVQSSSNNPALDLTNPEDYPRIGSQQISDADFSSTALDASIQRCVGVVRSPTGKIPRPPTVKNTAVVTEIPASMSAADIAAADGTDAVLPADGNAEYRLLYRLETVGNPGKYSVLADETTQDVEERRSRQLLKEQLWLIPRVKGNDPSVSGFTQGGSIATLVGLSNQVTSNAYDWLRDHKYVVQTSSYRGVGDCVFDIFYEHALGEKCYGELFLGVSVPTAQDNEDDYQTPYHAYLGNRGHWEVRLGASLAAQPLSRLNVKAEGFCSFVIPHEEQRHATFKGAVVKGVGPLIPAMVSWSYCVARIEATMFHFRARAISNMIGYELYYKERDSVTFPSNSLTSWLGRTFASDGTVLRNEYPLDASISSANTNVIAHRCKLETSFRVTSQCEFCLGFGYTFAGQNAPQAIDGSFALTVSF